MPMYEHRCKSCGHEFEKLVQSAEQKIKCIECDSEDLEKLLSLPSVAVSQSSPGMNCDPGAPPCSPTCCRLPQ